jgi:uncharacterized protein YndB with AHSA1/START domain
MSKAGFAQPEATIEPIRLTTWVRQPAADAFRLFTEGIGSWWPLHRGYSYGAAQAKEVHLEPVVGGRFYERLTNGDEVDVGRVLVCEPPRRIIFTWQGTDWPAATEVEVSFVPEEGLTRVDLVHRGWERLGATADEQRRDYMNGWPSVLKEFTTAAGALET